MHSLSFIASYLAQMAFTDHSKLFPREFIILIN